jgi:5-methyltetrahydropteroyltriglutamate--homocysteine methyltransferase
MPRLGGSRERSYGGSKTIRFGVSSSGKQDIGLEAVTDGEIRRGTWHMDFLCQIGGVTARGVQRRPFRNETGDVLNEIVIPKVTDRLHLERTIFGEDFVFLKAHTAAVPKLTIPSPNMLYGLGEVENPDVYADIELELRDLVDVYAEQMRRLELLGCRYLQIDDTTFATLGHAIFRNEGTAGARTADTPLSTFIGLMNAVLERKPPSMTVCVHTCRGNHRSAWIASGGYDAVAEAARPVGASFARDSSNPKIKIARSYKAAAARRRSVSASGTRHSTPAALRAATSTPSR